MNEDFNLDSAFRDATSIMKSFAVPAGADAVVVSASPKRIGLRFGSTAALSFYLSTDTMAGTGGGFLVNANKDLEINQRTHGDLATKQWHVFGAVAGNLNVVEVFATCPCPTGH